MNNKRIFINANRYELPYARRIQVLLESEYGYSTYINEQAEIENSLKYAANQKHLEKMLLDEIRSHSEILFLVTSQWRRKIFKSILKFEERNNIDRFKNINAKYYLDIDECWSYSGNDLQNYLSKSLKLSFERKNSPLLEALPEMPYELPLDPKKVWKYADELPEREKIVWEYAYKLFTGFSESLLLEALRVTHGEIAGLIIFFQANGVSFDNSTPSDMPLSNYIRRIFWDESDGLTYNQNYKNMKSTEILLSKFHMYPPHIPKGTVFISHSSQNLPLVRHLQLVAEESGYRTFAFRLGKLEHMQLSNLEDIYQVSQILQILENEITECDFILLANSKEAHLTPWTFAELATANAHSKSVYQIDVGDLDNLDFFIRNTELQKRFSAIRSKPNNAFEDIQVEINGLKYIMLAQSWINGLTSHTNEQIVNMIKSVSTESSERLSAFYTFNSLYYGRYESPETRERVTEIFSLLFEG